MPGAMVRWSQLRRRGLFKDPPNDLPQWEQKILDSLASLATVSAERWVVEGPYSGPSGQAIMASMGAMQSGWLLRIAPASLTCDVQLPNLGKEGAGRMISVQHTGGTRSALRLGYKGEYVSACTSPGQIAQCVWDGAKWWAVTGRIEWVDLDPSQPLFDNASHVPMVSNAITGWGLKWLCFDKGSTQRIWVGMTLPNGWIGTDVRPEVIVCPLASQNANYVLDLYWEFMGINAGPAVVGYSASPPRVNSQQIVTATTTGVTGIARRVAFSDIGTPISLLSTLDTFAFITVIRRGDLGTDTYTTQYAGLDANLALLRLSLRLQVCAHGASITG